MNFFTKGSFILTCLTIFSSVFAATPVPPWLDASKRASLLTDKNKAALSGILASAQTRINETALNSGTRLSQDRWLEASNGLNRSIVQLNEQIDNIKLSLSGIISKLTWKERLDELLNSLTYIYNIITITSRTIGDRNDRDSIEKLNIDRNAILTELDMTIKKITAKKA